MIQRATNWFRFQTTHSTPRRRSLQNGRRSQTASVEALENRSLLTTFTVLNLGDSGPGSLRQAVADANAQSGADTIVFQTGLTGIITLTSGQILISDEVEITGNGQASTVIDAGSLFRIFDVTTTAGDVTLIDLTLQNGQTSQNNINYSDMTNSGGAIRFLSTGLLTISGSSLSNNSTQGGGAFGGAIFADTGSVTIQRSSLSGNVTAGDGAYGAAIFSRSGDVSVSESTLSGNRTEGQAADGGAIFTANGNLRISRSTLSGNVTEGNFSDGGAVFARNSAVFISQSTISGNSTEGMNARGGGVYNNYGTITLNQSTVTQNSASISEGGGIFSGSASIVVQNSLVAGNTDNGSAPDIRRSSNVNVPLTVQFSLIGRNNGTNLTASGIINPDNDGNWIGGNGPGDAFDPLLAPLSNNGGLTQTHALLPNSRAFNGGSNALAVDINSNNVALTTDQRGVGFARTFFGIVDMGAFESQTIDTLAGSSGEDAFVARYSGVTLSSTVTVTVSSSGGPVRTLGIFPMNLPLAIDGSQGNDSIRIAGSNEDDFFRVTSASVFVNGAELALTSLETRTLVSGLGNETYRFDTDEFLGLYTIDDPGTGIDTLDFSPSTNPVNVNLATSATQVVSSTLSLNLISGARFENLIGGVGNDLLTGNALNNTISGGGGADVLTGSSGNDTMNGGAGDDVYVFGTPTAAEADVLTEGVNGGTDAISFFAINSPVTMSLATGAVQSVHTNRTIRLNSTIQFENLAGGSANDTLTGNVSDNTLTGNAGNDLISGGGGNDALFGGTGDDSYTFAAASAMEFDSINEGVAAGIDTISFASMTIPVTVQLATGGVQEVHSNRRLRLNSTLQFENLIGGSGSDSLTGNTVNNVIVGNAGNDTIIGGTGRDILIGGQGLDSLNGGADDDILIAGRTTHDASFERLRQLQTSWISASPYGSRVASLRQGVGSPPVALTAGVTVFNDTGSDDVLTGGSNSDWFFRAVDDAISDLFAGEIIDVL